MLLLAKAILRKTGKMYVNSHFSIILCLMLFYVVNVIMVHDEFPHQKILPPAQLRDHVLAVIRRNLFLSRSFFSYHILRVSPTSPSNDHVAISESLLLAQSFISPLHFASISIARPCKQQRLPPKHSKGTASGRESILIMSLRSFRTLKMYEMGVKTLNGSVAYSY